MSRTLLALPVVFALMLPATPALAAATGTSGYNNAPPKPSSGTGPSKETSTPKTTKSPSTTPTSSAPTSSSPASPTSQSTLPFTGLDLRWIVGFGVLLVGAGLSMRMTQRRQHHDPGR